MGAIIPDVLTILACILLGAGPLVAGVIGAAVAK